MTPSGPSNPWAYQQGEWEGESADAGFKRLSRSEAQEFRLKFPAASPWQVIAAQAALGVVVALMGWLLTRQKEVAWSLLFGAATAVIPGALMARGMTSRLSRMSVGAGSVSFMLWASAKLGVSMVMLLLAHRIVQALNWPALLLGLALCISVYWLALIWRPKNNEQRN